MEYNLVSGDSHVDMSWLPGDLFVENWASSLKERVPKVADTDEGERWLVGNQVLGVAGGAGFSFLPALRNKFRRMDRMIDMGFLDGMSEGRYHPTDLDLHIKDMALDGVWPDSKKIIEETIGQLDTHILKKITCENTVKRYRMGE